MRYADNSTPAGSARAALDAQPCVRAGGVFQQAAELRQYRLGGGELLVPERSDDLAHLRQLLPAARLRDRASRPAKQATASAGSPTTGKHARAADRNRTG
jgi:hypothetical protein